MRARSHDERALHVPNGVPNSAILRRAQRTEIPSGKPRTPHRSSKPRTSKPAGPCSPRVGRFDSFAAPPFLVRRVRQDRDVTEPAIVAKTRTPEGHEIVLLAIRWAKIIEGHPE